MPWRAVCEDIILNICSPIQTPAGKKFNSLHDFIASHPFSLTSHPWLDQQLSLWQQFRFLNQKLIFGATLPASDNLTQFPILNMADGEIVAYRLNKDYLSMLGEQQSAAYSSSFVLVKSICKPDPQQPASWLEFFTLYQGLAAQSDINSPETIYQAKTNLVQRQVNSGSPKHNDSNVENAPDKTGEMVHSGEKMQITLRKNFLNGKEIQPFGLARKLDANQQPAGASFWVTLLPHYVDQLVIYQTLTRVVMRTATDANTRLPATETPAAPEKSGKILNKGERVVVSQIHNFNNGGKIQPFGLARRIDEKGQEVGEAFWITTQSEFVKPANNNKAMLPWMQQAMDAGIYDQVVTPAQPIAISAGAELAYPGLHITELSQDKMSSEYGVYIELLSKSAGLNDVLRNTANVTAGELSIRFHKGAAIYRREGIGKNSTFTKTSEQLQNHDFDLRPLAKVHPLTDSQGQHWYQSSRDKWISGTEADLLHQFDLLQLGFSTLNNDHQIQAEPTTTLFSKVIACLRSLMGVKQPRKITSANTHYEAILTEIDSNQDGVITGNEIQLARQQISTPVALIAEKLILQHPSLWAEEQNYSALSEQLSSMPASRQQILRQWLSEQRWMSQITEFSNESHCWTADPLIFLNALADKVPDIYEFETTLGNYQISYKSAQFILSWEAYAEKPYVPAGSKTSGVTVGYGYDLGQQSEDSARTILSSFYPADQVNRLLSCIGKKGKSAQALLPRLADISISRENAFSMAMVLKKIYSQRLVNIYPQAIDLPPDSAGAILSLIYNRGTSMAKHKPGDTLDSRREMREIQKDLANNQIELIPKRLRSMKRLWPKSPGLIHRREGEAVLIENELARLTRK